jgi:hypothetical protein
MGLSRAPSSAHRALDRAAKSYLLIKKFSLYMQLLA